MSPATSPAPAIPTGSATHGPAARTAPVVQKLVDAGATMAGKTHTDELSRGIFGENAHYGTPINPRAPDRLPGGSSSGSAAATAGGLVDFALGTDTGGSVRVPASFCGLYGMRPSHGRLPLDGVLGQAPSYDTIGWLARDADLFARIGALLLDLDLKNAASPRRLIMAEDAFAVADPATRAALAPAVEKLVSMMGACERQPLSHEPLADWLRHQAALQGREAWATFFDWIDEHNPRFGFEIADNFLRGRGVDEAAYDAAKAFRAARRAALAEVLDDGTVVCLPTTPFPAPRRDQKRSTMHELRMEVLTLTCIAGTLGAPQVSLPLAEIGGLPVGLSLMAAPGNDAMLLALAQRIGEAVA